MNKRNVSFYEINQESVNAPTGEELDKEIFDFINNKGAVSVRAIIRHCFDYSQMQISQALGRLVANQFISRRNITLDEGD